MTDDEYKLVVEIETLKAEVEDDFFWANLASHADDGWIPVYTGRLRERLDTEAELGRSKADLVKESKAPKEDLHALRRRVAILHQEIHLLEQGPDIPAFAAYHRALVATGYGYVKFLSFKVILHLLIVLGLSSVNKTVFRRLYGF